MLYYIHKIIVICGCQNHFIINLSFFFVKCTWNVLQSNSKIHILTYSFEINILFSNKTWKHGLKQDSSCIDFVLLAECKR